VTKQWTTKWPYIANDVSELYKIVVKKVTFAGFMGAIVPPDPPLEGGERF